MLNVLLKIVIEYFRSRKKHGNWHDYPVSKMFEKIVDENIEVSDAINRCDHYGPHGVYNELAHVAVTAIKGMIVLRTRKGRC